MYLYNSVTTYANHRHTQVFTKEVNREFSKRGWARGSVPPEAEAKGEINVQVFLQIILGFNEYRSKAWTVFFVQNTILKNSKDSIGV